MRDNSLMEEIELSKENIPSFMQNSLKYELKYLKDLPKDSSEDDAMSQSVKTHIKNIRKNPIYIFTTSFNFVKTMFNVHLYSYINIIKNIGKKSVKLSGPIGMIRQAAENTAKGVPYFLTYLGIISIVVGVFNLLPIPPLDGGHILFTFIEIVFGESKLLEDIFRKFAISIVYLLIGLTLFADFGGIINAIYSKAKGIFVGIRGDQTELRAIRK
jgi:RIP metalloprotease RseP